MSNIKQFVVAVLIAARVAIAQPPQGKWLNTTADTQNNKYVFTTGGNLLLTEDYEVLQTHEVCASIEGYFLEKSNLGRYNVRFKGLRTYNEFTFATQYDAEKWVEKFCTAESLLSIKKGNGGYMGNKK